MEFPEDPSPHFIVFLVFTSPLSSFLFQRYVPSSLLRNPFSRILYLILYLTQYLLNHLFPPYLTLPVSSSEQALLPSLQADWEFGPCFLPHSASAPWDPLISHPLAFPGDSHILSSGSDFMHEFKISISYYCLLGIFTGPFYPKFKFSETKMGCYTLPSPTLIWA